MLPIHKKIVFSLYIVALGTAAHAQTVANKEHRTLIVFFDGLRPDYITAEAMPNLYAFSKKAVYGKQHHSVYPTVTRVNASSYSSGCYPGANGLLGNTVYFPVVDKKKGLNTGDASELLKIEKATNGQLLTTITLGEVLQSVGERMMVFSSGSTGQAMMQNHKVSGGAIVNPGLILPETIKSDVINNIGAAPANAKPNTQQHKWVTDALIKYGFAADGPLVNAIWFSDPDGTAHSEGIGSAKAVQSIKIVDAEFGRIVETLTKKELMNKYNIIISTDHGFVTNVGKESIAEFLIQQGLKKDKESEDVVVAEGAIYVQNHDEEVIKKIVTVLQEQPWIGPLFTKAKKTGSMKGWVKGTLSFDAIHWNHERSADILADENWDDSKNAAGYAGTSYSRGVAGHGGLSPYEVHIAFLAMGPDFKSSYECELPTGNIDIAPTILSIYKIPIPAVMNGRVMEEFLVAGKGTKDKAVKKVIKTSSKNYTLKLETTTLGKYRYIDFAKTVR